MDKIDITYGPQLSKIQVLSKYTTALKHFRSKADKLYDLRPLAFDNFVLFQYFQEGKNNLTELSLTTSPETSGYLNFSLVTYLKIELLNHILHRRQQIMYWLFYVLLAVLCISMYQHEPSTSAAERSVRSMVYPGMRIWRHMTLPLIELFPRLTELYDESCLMGNPFFQVDDVNCSPCLDVKSVIDLSVSFENKSTSSENEGETNIIKIVPRIYVPFLFKIRHDPIELQDVYNMYSNNQDIFERDAYRVYSTNHAITNLDELFRQFNETVKRETHNLWRCNRMLPARLLRKVVARPPTLPNSLALEKYMAIDTPQAQSYTLPNTECPNVYIQQSLGTRFIILRPTVECRHRCRTLSMRLPQSYVLSYNSWYWKPISAPEPVSDSMSISVIGSYC